MGLLGLKNKPKPGQQIIQKYKGVKYDLATDKDRTVQVPATAKGPASTEVIKGATQEVLEYMRKNIPGADKNIIEVGADGYPILETKKTSFENKSANTPENK